MMLPEMCVGDATYFVILPCTRLSSATSSAQEQVQRTGSNATLAILGELTEPVRGSRKGISNEDAEERPSHAVAEQLRLRMQ